MKKVWLLSFLIGVWYFLGVGVVLASPTINSVSDNRGDYTGDTVPKYAKFEATFNVISASATNFQFPYDAAAPTGILGDDRYRGLSVDGEFLPPGSSDWSQAIVQPGFYFRGYDDGGIKQSWADDGQEYLSYEWYYPNGNDSWKVRFAPNQEGTWQFRIRAGDASGSGVTSSRTFEVGASSNPGFIKVSDQDSRYFTFDNGDLFLTLGVEEQLSVVNPVSDTRGKLSVLAENGVQLVRSWHSPLFGSSWLQWEGGRGRYDGYLPRSGLEAFRDPQTGDELLTIPLIPYSDSAWYDACRMDRVPGYRPVKRNTTYRMQIRYQASCIEAAANQSFADFGVVGIISDPNDWPSNCHEPYAPDDSRVVTSYGKNTLGWGTVEGTWDSGDSDFLPRVAFAMNNVADNPSCVGIGGATGPKAWVESVSLQEDYGNGTYGPEILMESSMQYDTYFKDQYAYGLDKVVEEAEDAGVYIKMELMEKNDTMWKKLDDDGTYVIDGEDDNDGGVYGSGRTFNRTRWLQEAYWRYVQARWGYSTAIHSWEAMNEGDPADQSHWAMTDEMGKFLRCGVFGKDIGASGSSQHQASQVCDYEHPNWHLATTSFWHSFPGYVSSTGEGFWGSPVFPNIGYADGHAYITTSPASGNEALLMEADAGYYHQWHATEWGGWNFGYPVVRGEAGMTPRASSTDDWQGLGIENDTSGVWFHNFVWSSMHPGALYEIYWYYRQHINNGVFNHLPIHNAWKAFMAGIPLHNGNYMDANVVSDNTNLRIVGQKDVTNGNAHIWVQNKNHTWKNVVDGVSINPESGSLLVSGFSVNDTFSLEFWDTNSGTLESTSAVTSSAAGDITISISNLVDDVAIKIVGGNVSPSPTPILGDANGDTVVNVLDFQILSVTFGSTTDLRADFNTDGSVNVLDFQILANWFGN